MDTDAIRREQGRSVTRSVACQLRGAARQLADLADISAHPPDDQYQILSALQSINRALVELGPSCP